MGLALNSQRSTSLCLSNTELNDIHYIQPSSLKVWFCLWVCMCKFLQRPEEGVISSVAGVTGSHVTFVSCLLRVLGTRPQSSGRAASALCLLSPLSSPHQSSLNRAPLPHSGPALTPPFLLSAAIQSALKHRQGHGKP